MSDKGWVLVVDDDADVRETITLLLGHYGRRALGAADGQSALEVLRSHEPPAGVLLDLRMPRMSGAEVAQAMRADPSLAAVPIVVLSGDIRAADEGLPEASAVLRKPCDLDELLAIVDRYM